MTGSRRGSVPIIFFCAMLASASCSRQPTPVRACEAILLRNLKAPSTYKLVEPTVGLPKPNGTQDVFLRYDAVNSYNAPIRDVFWCTYDPKADTASQHDDTAIEPDDLSLMSDNLSAVTPAPSAAGSRVAPAERGGDAKTPSAEVDDEVPVCDRPDSPSKFALMNEIGTDCTGE